MSDVREIVVISGKGGTGKTSLTAAFAVLAAPAVIADCDVDAADLHLVLAPELITRQAFISGNEAVIRQADCQACGTCAEVCRFGAVLAGETAGAPSYTIDPLACEGCGVCVRWCPQQAVDFPARDCGEWFISSTRCGPMVHARLRPGAENSGRLVSLVREEARRIATELSLPLILIDGPPGIGCPVIAAITGSSTVLVVTEPTLSGGHDLGRVLQLTGHFGIPTAVCVNKWDINPELTELIEDQARQAGASPVGRLAYDRSYTAAQLAGCSVVDYADNRMAAQLTAIWEAVCSLS